MKCKTTVIWSLINGKVHEQTEEADWTIKSQMPLFQTLFPGLNYFSITGFGQVRDECVIPALKQLFPELVDASADSVDPEAEIELNEFLPSDGYEWQTSDEWRSQFEQLLAA